MKEKKLVLSLALLTISFGLCVSVVSAREGKGDQANGGEYRSAVSTSVQNLLNTANRERSSVRAEVKALVRQENEVKDKVADTIDKVQNRNRVWTFLVGADYKNIGELRSEMVKARNRLEQLKRITDKTTYNGKKAIEGDVAVLEAEVKKIEDFVKANEDQLSLFGWAVKMFSK